MHLNYEPSFRLERRLASFTPGDANGTQLMSFVSFQLERNIGVTCGCESQLALRCDLLDSSWSLYRDRAKKERAREKVSEEGGR